MAEVKLFSEFRSSYGHFYLIEIYDEDYTGTSPDQFNVTGNGFELTYSGETDNIYSPVIGSSVSFGMYVENSAITTFINNLKEYQQDRFFIKIWKGNYNGQDANTWYNTTKVSDDGLVMAFTTEEEQVVYLDYHWGGYIVQDIVEVEDVSQPYILNIQATDGISRLGDAVVTTSYQRKFTSQFINALDAAGVLGIYGSEHPVLAVVCNWWAQEMTYDANTNPLDDTWADFRAFDTVDEDGALTGRSWMEVLEQMCYIFGLRFYFSKGQYRVEQLFLRESSTMVEHRYKKDKTKIDNETVSYNKTIDQTSNKARLAGNIYNFLPAVNNVSVVVNKEPKAIIGVVSDETTQPTTGLGFIASVPANQMMFTFNHVGSVTTNVSVGNTILYMKLRLNVELYDFNNNVTYYLKRTFTGMTSGAISWTTTQSGSGYEVLIGPLQEFDRDELLVTGTTSIVTAAVPEDGDAEFDWEFVEFVTSAGVTHTLNAANDYGWQMRTRNFTTTNGQGTANKTTRTRAISPNTNIKSNLSYELPEMNLFTGNGERGSLVKQVTVLGINIRVPYTNWREGNSGTYKEIQQLICEEFMKLMDEPIEKYMGRMFSSHDFRQRLTFDSKNWIQLGGTYNANLDEWDGEWFFISRAAITVSFSGSSTSSNVIAAANVNGLTGNVSFDGIDSASVDANGLSVRTNADVGGNLGVTGNSTLAATSVGEFTTTNRVNVTINEIAGAAAGSETINPSNHFNFISYSGSNGNYTVNLPSAEDGVILRFKTDDTIGANRTITIQPQSGERIDAESDYTLDRSYDGISLLGKGSNWFVIQKKEK